MFSANTNTPKSYKDALLTGLQQPAVKPVAQVASQPVSSFAVYEKVNIEKVKKYLRRLKQTNLSQTLSGRELLDYAIIEVILTTPAITTACLIQLEQRVRDYALATGVLGNPDKECVFRSERTLNPA